MLRVDGGCLFWHAVIKIIKLILIDLVVLWRKNIDNKIKGYKFGNII